jgi:peptidoglycan/xylan/chitin deacetylase (PgdA/CDA1 family)
MVGRERQCCEQLAETQLRFRRHGSDPRSPARHDVLVIPTAASPESRLQHVAAGIAIVAALGFVVTASATTDLNRVATLALVGAMVAAGALVTNRFSASRVTIVVAALIALLCTWLLPQRDDAGTALILGALFGAALGLIAHRSRSQLTIGIAFAGGAALVGARLLTDQVIVAGLVALAVLFVGIAATPRAGRRVTALVTALATIALVFTAYLGAETPSASWFGGGYTHGPTNRDEVALTFDDGPNIGASLEIMKILDRYDAKGTFFEVGKAIDADPRITRALYADGQLLGNHSYHHDQWRWLDPRYPELERTQDAFQRAIGTCPVLYRPPHGERTPLLAHVVREHDMHMVLWNVSAGDWATNDARLVADRILRRARPGAILLLHDGLDGVPSADRSVLIRALPLILDGLRDKGLKPVRLDAMLGLPAYQPCD